MNWTFFAKKCENQNKKFILKYNEIQIYTVNFKIIKFDLLSSY